MGCSSLLPEEIAINRKSICKIDHSSKIYSGFLLKFFKQEKDSFCLVIPEEVISNELNQENEDINFFYDSESKQKKISLNPKERLVKNLKDNGINLIIIEILPLDEIEEKYFLAPPLNYIDEIDDLKNEEISIIKYSKDKFMNANGKIKEIKQSGFTYTANIEDNSSGLPIFLKEDFELIGVQIGSKNNNSENDAVFIGEIIKLCGGTGENNINEGNFHTILTEGNEDKKVIKKVDYYSNGTIKYEGDWFNGYPEGNGKFIDKEENYYIGVFKKGEKAWKRNRL